MQREIKFRGISKDEHPGSTERKGQFIYGDLANYHDGTYGIFDRDEEWHYDVIPETVGQYTGLKDKNGKEIYEGDIVKGTSSMNIYKVVYKQGCFMIANITHTNANLDMVSYNADHIEVIGNIHDNPELLRETECELLDKAKMAAHLMPIAPCGIIPKETH